MGCSADGKELDEICSAPELNSDSLGSIPGAGWLFKLQNIPERTLKVKVIKTNDRKQWKTTRRDQSNEQGWDPYTPILDLLNFEILW